MRVKTKSYLKCTLLIFCGFVILNYLFVWIDMPGVYANPISFFEPSLGRCIRMLPFSIIMAPIVTYLFLLSEINSITSNELFENIEADCNQTEINSHIRKLINSYNSTINITKSEITFIESKGITYKKMKCALVRICFDRGLPFEVIFAEGRDIKFFIDSSNFDTIAAAEKMALFRIKSCKVLSEELNENQN